MLKHRLLLAVFFLLASAAARADDPLPKDVRDFVFKREGCDHFRGEIPEPRDKRRMREVNRELVELCKGTDKTLAKLKKKYAAKAGIMRQLGEFEEEIEKRCTAADRRRHHCRRMAMSNIQVRRISITSYWRARAGGKAA